MMSTATAKRTVIPRNFKPLSRAAHRWAVSNGIHVQRLGTKQKRWIKALESGDYNKARGYLRLADKNGKNYHCCLGVACELVDGVSIDTDNHDGYEKINGNNSPRAIKLVEFDTEEAVLPNSVADEFDFHSTGGVFKEDWCGEFEDYLYDIEHRRCIDKSKWPESAKEFSNYYAVFLNLCSFGFNELTEMNDGLMVGINHKGCKEEVVYTHKQIAAFIRAYPQAIFSSAV